MLQFRYKTGGSSYHEGGPADGRMAAAAAKRGIELTSLSRPLRPDDLVRYEYILAMDFENKAAIELAADHWAGEGLPVPKTYREKVHSQANHTRNMGLLLSFLWQRYRDKIAAHCKKA